MAERIPFSVWPTAQATSRCQRLGRYLPESMAHPAKMLPAIARMAIEAYTAPGDVVLDPMCGIGTTLVEAVHLGRRAVGIEYEERWAELARANVAHARTQGASAAGTVVTGDARQASALIHPQLRGEVALVLTSPPYGDSVHGHVTTTLGRGVTKFNTAYSHDRENLAHVPVDELLVAFTSVLTSAAAVLRPGGVVAVTARPWRRHGELIDLPGMVVGAGEEAGLVPFERNVVLLAALRGEALVPRASFFQLDGVRKARRAGVPLRVIAHEDLIVLRSRDEQSYKN